MKKNWTLLLILLLLIPCFGGCTKEPVVEPTPEEESEAERQAREQSLTYEYVNTFAMNWMRMYYLWTKEIASDLNAWKATDEPISKVREIRYKNASGRDIDRWSIITDDYASFYGNVSGTQKSYGFDFLLGKYGDDNVFVLVTFTYSGGPAEEAGLKRGDIITSLNGKLIPIKSYATVINQELLSSENVILGLYSGDAIPLTAQEMYENPVLLSKVFDVGGKKVGYLVYTSFTLDSYKDLISACKTFKVAGVSELILDLRYNGGGFSIAEEFLASMLAPESEVAAGSVLSTEVFNEALTDYFKEHEIDNSTYFKTEYKFTASDGKKYDFSTAGANIGISKLYAIVTSGTASASESLLCELYPYLDITLVGDRTSGKFCSGLVLKGPDFFDDYADLMSAETVSEGKKYTNNWGLYVMYSRFADKDGVTRCMPYGLEPDYEVEDNPMDGFALGDPKETMLAKVLDLCGYKPVPTARLRSKPHLEPEFVPLDFHRPGFGVFLKLPELEGDRRPSATR